MVACSTEEDVPAENWIVGDGSRVAWERRRGGGKEAVSVNGGVHCEEDQEAFGREHEESPGSGP